VSFSSGRGFANGLKAKVRFNELSDLAVLFRELLLLAPNSFEGGAEAFSTGEPHLNLLQH
jgi:hypothetical protein